MLKSDEVSSMSFMGASVESEEEMKAEGVKRDSSLVSRRAVGCTIPPDEDACFRTFRWVSRFDMN